MKKSILLLLLTWISGWATAQEILVPLVSNPVLSARSKTLMKGAENSRVTLTLPFIDDFSEPGYYPDDARWSDRDVFINNDMAKYPPSQGVATFDALDDTGALHTNASSFSFISDYLTSHFIDLSALAPDDSVYLSFYYQPGGLGNKPDPSDSLLLQFLEDYHYDTLVDTTVIPYDTTFLDKWRTVWASPGMELDTFRTIHHQWFGQVMVPCTDAVFFRNNFQFRFFNYASLASSNIPSWRSNADFWHLDYVYMNTGRTFGDTLHNDMTFVNQAPCMLAPYKAMTMRQYLADPAAFTRDSLELLISNLGKDTLICRYRSYIVDETGTEIHTYDGGNYNLYPFYLTGYQDHPSHYHPPTQGFVFPGQAGDSTTFLITHIVERVGISQEFIRQNDTLRYQQKFYNYLAYDDGTPEAGYGLSPDGALLAYRFTLKTADTLRGVQIFFNRTLENSSQRNFRLVVWADNGGYPGTVLYRSDHFLKPIYEDSLNTFHSYILDTDDPLVLDNNHKTFYVGWQQQTDDNLNVGFDSTSNARENIYFNISGSWQKTAYKGALMIRPMLGPALEPPKIIPGQNQGNLLSIYPNPSTGNFTLVLPKSDASQEIDKSQYVLRIYDQLGRKVATYPYLDTYDLHDWTRGLYLVELSTLDGYLNYQGKLVLTQ